MPRNISKDTINSRFLDTVRENKKQVREQRTNQSTWQGYFPLPVRASDPPVTQSGQFGAYYNSGTGKIKVSYNGGAWANYAP